MAKTRFDLSSIGENLSTNANQSIYDLTSQGGQLANDNEQQIQPYNGGSGFYGTFLGQLAPNILAGGMELGHSIINAPSNIANFMSSKGIINPSTAQAIPRQQDYNASQMLKLPQNTTNNLVQALVKNMPALDLGGFGLGTAAEAAENIPYIGTLLSGATNMANRIIPQAAWGFATNKNPEQGAKDFGGQQALMEGLTTPIRLVSQLAELINPLDFAQKQAGNIADYVKNAKQYQQEAYSYIDPYKEDIIANSSPTDIENNNYLGYLPEDIKATYSDLHEPVSYIDHADQSNLIDVNKIINPDSVKYFPMSVKKMYENFLNKPNLDNAHKLQSQIFSAINNIKKGDAYSNEAISAMNGAREDILDLITNHLQSVDPKAAAQYNQGRYITRELISPALSNKTLRQVSAGKSNIQPKDLYNAITSGLESGAIPQDHYLAQIASELGKKIKVGDAVQYALPIGASLAGGHLTPWPGYGGGLLGGVGAGMMAHYIEPALVHFVQNPVVQNLFKKSAPIFYGAGRGIAGYNANKNANAQ